MHSANIKNMIRDRLTSSKNKTLLLDGEWGIGKSYLCNDFLKETLSRNKDFSYINISLFGINNIIELEKTLIRKCLFPTFEKYTNNKFASISTSFYAKIIKDIGVDALKNTTGISIDPLSYIDKLTLDQVDFGELDLVVIDDLERLTPDMCFIKLLGIIERISKSTNVIVICNKEKLQPEAQELYSDFHDKVIDYEIKLTKIDKDILENIVNYKKYSPFSGFNELIIDKFYDDEIQNIRIFKKTLDLVVSAMMEIERIIGIEHFDVTYRYEVDELIYNCGRIIRKTCNKSSKIDNNKEMLYQLNQFYNYGYFDKDIIYAIFDKSRPINKDLNVLSKIYIEPREKIKHAWNNLKINIEEYNKSYFNSQVDVIRVFRTLINLELPNKYYVLYYEQLVILGNDLYSTNIGDLPLVHDVNKYYYYDYYGESIDRRLVNLINELNKNNICKYLEYRERALWINFKSNNFKVCSQIIKEYHKYSETLIKNYYELFIIIFDDNLNSEYWEMVISFISAAKSTEEFAAIDNLLLYLMNNSRDFIERRRIKEIDSYLKENEYQFSQQQQYYENMKND